MGERSSHMDGIFRSAKNRGNRIKTLVKYVKPVRMETRKGIINCKLRGRTHTQKRAEEMAGQE